MTINLRSPFADQLPGFDFEWCKDRFGAITVCQLIQKFPVGGPPAVWLSGSRSLRCLSRKKDRRYFFRQRLRVRFGRVAVGQHRDKDRLAGQT